MHSITDRLKFGSRTHAFVKWSLRMLCDSDEQKDLSDKLCNVYTPIFQLSL